MANSSPQDEPAQFSQNGGINGVDEESPLHDSVKAKNMIIAIFRKLSDTLKGFERLLITFDENKPEIRKVLSKVSNYQARVSKISKVLLRDQMKVTFIGRTSNGKSTTINAMLHNGILLKGIGLTTDCFLSVHGLDSPDPYILVPVSDDEKDKEKQPLDQLTHILSKEKHDPGSFVQVFLPKSSHEMLPEGVVFVDSPGIGFEPDLDLCIEEHCLDTDVFVLVANAESALTYTEKNFFLKVNEHLSRPNIFILYNRCDASASEPERMRRVKKEHLNRSINFLVDELKYVDKGQAEDRVFFVSAQETLKTRMHQDVGTFTDAEFATRQKEFENFESKFQECITKSALQTKFESHAVSGLTISKSLQDLMEVTKNFSCQQRSQAEKAKKEQEKILEDVEKGVETCRNDIERQIREITSKVEDQATEAMRKEIGRLDLLVNGFDCRFNPYPKFLEVYKKELYDVLKWGLGREMITCSNTQTQVICKAQNEMADRLSRVLPQIKTEASLQLVISSALDFQANLEPIVTSLCTDFQEDVKFHLSLVWRAILRNLLGSERFNDWGAKIQRNMESLGSIRLVVLQGSALIMALMAALLIINEGLIRRTIGWWFMAFCVGLYCVVYVIARAFWTAGAKEKAFKRQFVNYATEKLQSQVNIISAKCSGQVQQELTSTLAKLESPVQREVENLKKKINKLGQEITGLEETENKLTTLRNKASRLKRELYQFITEFGLEKSKI